MAEFDLITCIVQRGRGDKVSKIALQAGAEGVTTYFASGTGVRQKLGMLGTLIKPEKEVILIATKHEQTDEIFGHVSKAAHIEEQGQGLIFVQKIEKIAGLLNK